MPTGAIRVPITMHTIVCRGHGHAPHKFVHYARREGRKKLYCDDCLRLRTLERKKKGRAIKEYKKALLKELRIVRGKLILEAYHSGQKANVDWINHRIEEISGKNHRQV
jgi:hypothetical protein